MRIKPLFPDVRCSPNIVSPQLGGHLEKGLCYGFDILNPNGIFDWVPRASGLFGATSWTRTSWA